MICGNFNIIINIKVEGCKIDFFGISNVNINNVNICIY